MLAGFPETRNLVFHLLEPTRARVVRPTNMHARQICAGSSCSNLFRTLRMHGGLEVTSGLHFPHETNREEILRQQSMGHATEQQMTHLSQFVRANALADLR